MPSPRYNRARSVAGCVRSPPRIEPYTSKAASTCPITNRFATVPTVAGTFSPLRPRLRLDGHSYSPAVLEQIVTAAARLGSFADAAFAVGLTGLSISPRHVQQLTQEIGADLGRQRDAQAVQRRRRQLPPQVEQTPQAVVVEIDGGRLRTRASGQGRGVHQAENKEDKIACLATLESVEHAADPQPEPTPTFVQPRRVQRLVQQMAGQAAESGRNEDDSDAESRAAAESGVGVELPSDAGSADEAWTPKRLLRTCVASMADSRSFGPMVAGETQARDFYAAPRRAFVADGLAYNWSIQHGYFPDFEPIVDFLHVVCYLYKAAYGLGGDEALRWSRYEGWLRRCWQGQVAEVVVELTAHQGQVGCPPPAAELAANDVRRLVAEALSYLSNNAERMDYPRYRRLGLPTTSSLVESLVGEFNARVKSKQKYWNRGAGAEAMLQVRSAYLSEDGRLQRYFVQRPGNPYRRRAA